MMHDEFEKLAGYRVSHETYANVIEPMYMALPESVSKQQFIAMLDKKAFALPTHKELVTKIRKIAKMLFENCGRACFYEEEEEMMQYAYELAKLYYGIDRSDIHSWVYCTRTTALYGTVQEHGSCTCPIELVIGCERNGREYELERITLVKVN